MVEMAVYALHPTAHVQQEQHELDLIDCDARAGAGGVQHCGIRYLSALRGSPRMRKPRQRPPVPRSSSGRQRGQRSSKGRPVRSLLRSP